MLYGNKNEKQIIEMTTLNSNIDIYNQFVDESEKINKSLINSHQCKI